MKNLLTIVALLVSLSGIAASLLREEMRCYLGLPSQSCPTAENPSLPVSLPEKANKQETKANTPVSFPKPSKSSSQVTSEATTDDLDIPVESAQVIDSESGKIPSYDYAEDGIPIPIEPYDPSEGE